MDLSQKPKTTQPEETFELWAENLPAVELFLCLHNGGAWRVVAGMAGAIIQGLDFQAIEALMNIKNIKRKQRPQLFEDIQHVAAGALKVLNAK